MIKKFLLRNVKEESRLCVRNRNLVMQQLHLHFKLKSMRAKVNNDIDNVN